jgi:hypothetical protein
VGLQNPVAIYTAESNLESALICDLLTEKGFTWHVTGDAAQFVGGIDGLLPWTHKPQIWVERANAEEVRPLIAELDRQFAARRSRSDGDATVDVVCEECNTISTYPTSRRGYVETCAHGGAYVDVGEPDDWSTAEDS